jgi:diguanylate cyclase (GGDEF)-like protein
MPRTPAAGRSDPSRAGGSGEHGAAFRRLWLAMLSLALLPMAAALLITAALTPGPDEGAAAGRAWQLSAVAADLAARHQRASARLLEAARDPVVTALLAGHDADPGAAAARVLATMRESGTTAVRAACVVHVTGRGLAVADVAPANRAASAAPGAGDRACPTGALVASLGMGGSDVAYDVVRDEDGTADLLLTAALPGDDGRATGIVAARLAVADLLGPALGTAPGASAALLVDVGSGAVVATGPPSGTSVDADAARAPGPFPATLATVDDGTLGGTLGDGWTATTTLLPLASHGPSLALLAVWPVDAPSPPWALVLALALLATLALMLAVVVARRFERPLEVLARSQTHLEALYAAARQDSLQDALTGLGNHRAFQEELERQMDAHRRHGVPVSLLLVDVDDLKVVNDSEGHPAGDQLLQSVAAVLARSMRSGDLAFRIGGDEFAVVMPHTDADSARVPAERLLDRCLRPAPGERAIAFSGGISAVPYPARDRDELYQQADAALYWCKRHGQASIEVFDPQRHLAFGQGGDVEVALTAVTDILRRRHLVPSFQPIIDLDSGAVTGFEGLVGPGAGTPFGSHGTLVAAAAACGLATRLDLAGLDVLARAGRDLDARRDLSVNLAVRTLEARDFSLEWLLDPLGRQGIAPGRLIVELDERDPVASVPALARNLAALRELGIRVAADEVGPGDTGLHRLAGIPLDLVKVSLARVGTASPGDPASALLRVLRDMAGRKGTSVVVTGVETAAQLRMLRELGVPAAQGGLLGRPGPDTAVSSVDLEALEAAEAPALAAFGPFRLPAGNERAGAGPA